jgi:hypothetical protein
MAVEVAAAGSWVEGGAGLPAVLSAESLLRILVSAQKTRLGVARKGRCQACAGPLGAAAHRPRASRVVAVQRQETALQAADVQQVHRDRPQAAVPPARTAAEEKPGSADRPRHARVDRRQESGVGLVERIGSRPAQGPAAGTAAGFRPGAAHVIRRPTRKTVVAPTTLYQRKATPVKRETRKTAAIPAKSP